MSEITGWFGKTEKPGQRVRVLRNVHIDEISLVKRGAGRGVEVMLAKRDDDDTQEDPVQTQPVDIAKSVNLFGALVDMICIRDKCNRSAGIDQAMRAHPELFEIAKGISAARVLAKASSESPLYDASQHGRSDGSGFHPPTPSGVETGEQALARLRSQHPSKILEAYGAAVKAKMALGMSASNAHDRVRLDTPHLWEAAKSAQPISHPSPDTSHSSRQRAFAIG
jgi:hypothetical protein